jgi:poly(3-hydroxybutyrate) depolymerase
MLLLASIAFTSATAAYDSSNASGVPQPSVHDRVRCSVNGDVDGRVLHFSDGTQARCIAVIAPSAVAGHAAAAKLPVLFWFHGGGGSAATCGTNASFPVSLAKKYGFALVCAEAVQYAQHGRPAGQWNIPNVITDATGTPCADSDSYDRPYVKNALAQLEQLGRFDTSRVFFSGCSDGSGFSIYASTCTKQDAHTAHTVSAFATHSTGLKIKGDNITWDCCSDIETCDACQYFPAKPFAVPPSDPLGLKACIFDNTADRLPPDPTSHNPFFYLSSEQLAAHWRALGNKAETHFKPGGHCQDIPFAQIASCLDDGTGRLLRGIGASRRL